MVSIFDILFLSRVYGTPVEQASFRIVVFCQDLTDNICYLLAISNLVIVKTQHDGNSEDTT